jgi:hypothetical protein
MFVQLILKKDDPIAEVEILQTMGNIDQANSQPEREFRTAF